MEEKPLTTAMEDYLEASFDLDQEKKVADESWLKHSEEYRVHGFDPEKCRDEGSGFVCELQSRVDALDKKALNS